MATTNTKKAMPKKTATKKVTENKEIYNEEMKEIESNTKVEKDIPVKEYKINYEPTDGVLCSSVTAGQLIMIGKKTGNLYTWSGIGDSTEVEYQDLKAEKLTRGVYVFRPLFLVEDNDLLQTKEWAQVQELYDTIYSRESFEEIFNLDAGSFKRTLTQMPLGVKNSLKTIAVTKIEDGSLDSINKIKIIDDVLGTDLINSYIIKGE